MRIRIALCLLGFFLLSPKTADTAVSSYGQSDVIPSPNFINAYCSMRDGGIAIATRFYTYDQTDSSSFDLQIFRLNPQGRIVGARQYRHPHDQVPTSIVQTLDGGFAVAGYTAAPNGTGDQGFLLKTDSLGVTEFIQHFGGPAEDRLHAVEQTRDSGYVLVGSSIDSSRSDHAALIITDKAGNILRSREFLDYEFSAVRMVKAAPDGGFILAGAIRGAGENGLDACLLKTDSVGSTLWVRRYGGLGDDEAFGLDLTANGGYIVSGYKMNPVTMGKELALIKTDAIGALEWVQVRSGDGTSETGISVKSKDSGYVIHSLPNRLVKMDLSGNFLWSQQLWQTYDPLPISPVVDLGSGKVAVCASTYCRSFFDDQFGAPLVTVQPRPQYPLLGKAARFEVIALGTNLTYQWRKNGQNISGAQSRVLVTSSVAPSDTGSFDVVISNSRGRTTSEAARLRWHPRTRIVAVAGGGTSTHFIDEHRTLWSVGCNWAGQLGVSSVRSLHFPVPIAENVVQVSASAHLLFLKSNGELWGTGLNREGQLGVGNKQDRYTPYFIMGGVASMSAGVGHTLIVKQDGSLWACGSNEYGQLGNGTTQESLSPTFIMSGVREVSAGSWSSMILKTDGSLWACGWNGAGILGDGTQTNRSSPIQVLSEVTKVSAGYTQTLALKTDGTAWAWGGSYRSESGTVGQRWSPFQIMAGVQDVDAYYHGLLLTTEGVVWGFGNNIGGALGIGRKNYDEPLMRLGSGVVDIEAGPHSSYALRNDGVVWVAGYNGDSRLGTGDTEDALIWEPIAF